MKNRLLTGGLAAFLAIVIVTGSSAKPARAVWGTWVTIALNVATSLYAGGGGSGDIERAKREIIAAINNSRQEILNHIDAIASADVRACTEASTMLVANIDLMDPYTLGSFAVSATNCATLSTAYFDAVQDKAAADNIGKLMGTIYAVAMVGFAKLGFPTRDLLDGLIRGYDAVVVKLAPTCVSYRNKEPGQRVEEFYQCTAYNGDYGVTSVVRPAQLTESQKAGANRSATRNTSRIVAQDQLPGLRQLRASMG